jgi:uncharacterized membrane protein YcaP (DUF421 family)
MAKVEAALLECEGTLGRVEEQRAFLEREGTLGWQKQMDLLKSQQALAKRERTLNDQESRITAQIEEMAKVEAPLLEREGTLGLAEEHRQTVFESQTARAPRQEDEDCGIQVQIDEDEAALSASHAPQGECKIHSAPDRCIRGRPSQIRSTFQCNRALRLGAALRDDETTLAISGPRLGAPEAIKLAQDAYDNV